MDKILIVDDERLIRENLKRLLVLEDYEVVTGKDGIDGLQVFESEKPQVVILDMKMPGKDGMEVLKDIKQSGQSCEVIIVTGHGGIDSAVQAMQDGAFGYIQKPIDFDQLEIEIKRALEKQAIQSKLDTYVKNLERVIKEKDEEIERRKTAEAGQKEANQDIIDLNTNLKDTLKKLEQANHAKSQFLANMSHELRTPLNSIIGFSKMLTKTTMDTTQQDYVATITDASNLLLSVISDILDVSKIEAGKIDLEHTSFNMETLVQSVIKLVSGQLEDRAVKIGYSYDDDTPRAYKGDPTRIRQIFVNLINNAIKFTETGEIKISVTRDKNADGKQRLICKVKDTGVGISEEKLKSIFSAFEQEDTSTTRKYGGTGLGLYIVSSLVDKMEGTIQVTSEKGKGSEFTFAINLEETEDLTKSDIQLLPIAQLKEKKLLIVDDTKKNRVLLEDFCSQLQITILHQTSSGNLALDWLKGSEELPDLIITDLAMPGIGGIELAGQIKKEDRFKHIKLLALTSEARSGTSKNSENAGFDGYLSLPILQEDLTSTLRAMFGDKRVKAPIITKHVAEELSLKGVKILAAEDDRTNQKFLRAMLGSLGCEITIAENGKIAIDMLNQGSYDIVLMDLQMPVMGGEEATHIIRHKVDKEIPIIALTANVTTGEKEKCLLAGMNDFLSKPVDPSMLNEMIQKWVEKK